MGRIKRHFWRGKRKAPPPGWAEQLAAANHKIGILEARVKTRDQELVKEYKRRQRATERVNVITRKLREVPNADAVKSQAVELFAAIYADMMRQATDNRALEVLMQLGPHTISDARIGGDIDEEKQPPRLWLTLPELEISVRVDERIWPAERMSLETARKLLRGGRYEDPGGT